jgi:hypothetical protein
MGVDRPAEQEVAIMRTEDYETAEMRFSGRVWWCWSITMQRYWRPDTDGVDTWAGPDAPGHWPQCGYFTETPSPRIYDDSEELGDGQ